MRIILLIISLIWGLGSYSQCLNPPIDTLFPGDCSFIIQNPSLQPGSVVTRCFYIQMESDIMFPGLVLIQSPSCGPFAYSYLNFSIYDSTCSSLITSGQVFPVPNNVIVTLPYYPATFVYVLHGILYVNKQLYVLIIISHPFQWNYYILEEVQTVMEYY